MHYCNYMAGCWRALCLHRGKSWIIDVLVSTFNVLYPLIFTVELSFFATIRKYFSLWSHSSEFRKSDRKSIRYWAILVTSLSPSTLSIHPSHTWQLWMFHAGAMRNRCTLHHGLWIYCRKTNINWYKVYLSLSITQQIFTCIALLISNPK
jgi:hypothetical protein